MRESANTSQVMLIVRHTSVAIASCAATFLLGGCGDDSPTAPTPTPTPPTCEELGNCPAQETKRLTVAKAGTGDGTVTSNPVLSKYSIGAA